MDQICLLFAYRIEKEGAKEHANCWRVNKVSSRVEVLENKLILALRMRTLNPGYGKRL